MSKLEFRFHARAEFVRVVQTFGSGLRLPAGATTTSFSPTRRTWTPPVSGSILRQEPITTEFCPTMSFSTRALDSPIPTGTTQDCDFAGRASRLVKFDRARHRGLRCERPFPVVMVARKMPHSIANSALTFVLTASLRSGEPRWEMSLPWNMRSSSWTRSSYASVESATWASFLPGKIVGNFSIA